MAFTIQTNVDSLIALENLRVNLAEHGFNLDTIPLTLQFNKRDLPDVYDEAEVLERWAQSPWPVVFATALQGPGVFETLEALLARLYDHLEGTFALRDEHGLTREHFVGAVLGEVPAPVQGAGD